MDSRVYYDERCFVVSNDAQAWSSRKERFRATMAHYAVHVGDPEVHGLVSFRPEHGQAPSKRKVVRFGDKVTLRCITQSKGGSRFLCFERDVARGYGLWAGDASQVALDEARKHVFRVVAARIKGDAGYQPSKNGVQVVEGRAGDALRIAYAFVLQSCATPGHYVAKADKYLTLVQSAQVSPACVFRVQVVPDEQLRKMVEPAMAEGMGGVGCGVGWGGVGRAGGAGGVERTGCPRVGD